MNHTTITVNVHMNRDSEIRQQFPGPAGEKFLSLSIGGVVLFIDAEDLKAFRSKIEALLWEATVVLTADRTAHDTCPLPK